MHMGRELCLVPEVATVSSWLLLVTGLPRSPRAGWCKYLNTNSVQVAN